MRLTIDLLEEVVLVPDSHAFYLARTTGKENEKRLVRLEIQCEALETSGLGVKNINLTNNVTNRRSTAKSTKGALNE